RNVMSGNLRGGLFVSAGADVKGNFIGTDKNDATAIPNNADGISAGSGNTIGGTAAGALNLISGNGRIGAALGGSDSGQVGAGNLLQGNLIGTDVSGTKAVPNGDDAVITSGGNNIIGGTTPAARNIISGNRGRAVVFFNSFPVGNRAQGNFVGTDISGALPLLTSAAELQASHRKPPSAGSPPGPATSSQLTSSALEWTCAATVRKFRAT